MLASEPAFHKKIRSFILRQGRLTGAQQHALTHYWDDYCLDQKAQYDFCEVFGRDAQLVVEIGFGNGESLAQMALANPETDYVGIEVHRPGVGHLLMLLHQQGIENVRVYCHDAVEVLEKQFPDDCLTGVHLFFPDPWPKKKHHKRRIVNAGFVGLLLKKLKVGGYFHGATDWENYAESMLAILSEKPGFINTSPANNYCTRPEYRPVTKFEQRGLRLGHGVWDLIFTKQ